MDWDDGATKAVYPDRSSYPRLIASDHGDGYSEANVDTSVHPWSAADYTPMGGIPQVAHTYGYLEGAYGIMNEHQLSIG